MKAHFKNLINILLVAIVIILLLQRSCQPKPPTGIQTQIETKYDTIIQISEVYTPIYKTKIKTNWDTLYVNTPMDTVYIIEDYHTKYNYLDTIEVDSFGYVVINDTIYQNKIFSRQYKSNIIIPTTTITNTILENKREFYVGLEAGVTTKGNINYAGSQLLFKTKRKQIYGVGVGLDQDFTSTIRASMY